MLLGATIQPIYAQFGNNNQDEVFKVAPHTKGQHVHELSNAFVPGQVLVKFKDASTVNVRRAGGSFVSVDKKTVDDVLKEFGTTKMEKLLPNEKSGRSLRCAKSFVGQTIQERDLSQLYLVQIDAKNVAQTEKMVKSLQTLNEVEFAEPNYKMYTMESHIADNYSGNPYAGQQWGLNAYGVPTLWNKPIINKERPVIAIVDTGVDITHPDLKDNIWTNTMEAEGAEGYDNDNNGFVGDIHGYDFVSNSGKMRDNNMHGTHVAGIAAAANNETGIIGANPQALIMPVTVMQSDGTGDVATIIKGIDYAVANGATIINLSLGTYANSIALRQCLEKAYQKAVIVAAAGNDGKGIYPICGCNCYYPMFPAAYSFVLGVQATADNSGNLARFSNFDCDGPLYSEITTYRDEEGFNYELTAPGVDILSTIPGGAYKSLNGTSMAAPLVAGAISALQMVKQYDTQEMLWGDLLHSADIAGAFNISERPAEVDMLRVQYNDRESAEPASGNDEDQYSADGEVDAGETISVYPVIRTTFGPARNIKMHLEMGDFEDPDQVEILNDANNKVDFGMNLDSYGRGVSLNPLKLKIPSTVADGRHIKMKVIFSCDGVERQEGKFTMIVANLKKISGLIDKDMTLTADHVWYANENIAVLKGTTLTIEPGTRIEFAAGMGLSSSGKLIANGTPEKPIVFARHIGEGAWTGVKSHQSDGQRDHGCYLYTNADSTLFTLAKTDRTPKRIDYNLSYNICYNKEKVDKPEKTFELRNYMIDLLGSQWSLDMTSRMDKLTDPDFLTPAVLAMKKDILDYYNNLLQSSEYRKDWSEDMYNPETGTSNWESCSIWGNFVNWSTYDNPRDTISYCRIEGFSADEWENVYPYMKDCYISPNENTRNSQVFRNLEGIRNVITGINAENNINQFATDFDEYSLRNLKHTNIINNTLGVYGAEYLPRYSWLNENNWFNNGKRLDGESKYAGKYYSIGINTKEAMVDKSTTPSYLGSAREDLLRPSIYELGNAPNTFGKIDLSNMATRPIKEAHGVIWKIVVNGYDAQDQYDELPPLGVGKHKFEIYFSRPMNKAAIPQVSYGVRDPYTQNTIEDEGSWNEDGTIYTVYTTITGKTNSDGKNRLYVYGAQDNEFFECPYERTRFHINVQAAGSMATGFAAEPGMGKVTLTWNNDENNFDDAMGFNIYRYHEYEDYVTIYDEWGNPIPDFDGNGNWQYDEIGNPIFKKELKTLRDTVRINQDIVDIKTTKFVDYEVTPKVGYYYYYKVLSTDLKEYDVSNVVYVVPQTSTRGDANGSGAVDVNDVITTVNYAAGKEPRPFIFEAADMNKDEAIDILDVIGIIQGVMNPTLLSTTTVSEKAVYTIENGVVYVESPVALAGVQIQLIADKNADIKAGDALEGFERTSAWLSDDEYIFLAYNMNGKTLAPGKHAILNIGNAEISAIRLGDVAGNEVVVIGSEPTGINGIESNAKIVKGVYNVKGQKVAKSDAQLEKLPKGVYIINGVKVLK